MSIHSKVDQYEAKWRARGYPAGVPDEVPEELATLLLAPSYRAVALAILKNDHGLLSLGASTRSSPWYDALKHEEIAARRPKARSSIQLELLART